ncbi:hypothetical protein C8Q80DRAFT_1276719 [Daedaleopsis nitida]|nr:hypothetical protein C8Q80DRAFT_1276719 [Daedaleopsis nitida]
MSLISSRSPAASSDTIRAERKRDREWMVVVGSQGDRSPRSVGTGKRSVGELLDETKKERDGYIVFEKEQGEADAKIERLTDGVRLGIEQLKDAEHEREELQEELNTLEREENSLEEEEAEWFWQQHKAQQHKPAEQVSQLAALRVAYATDSAVEWAEINAASGQTLLLLYTIERKPDFTVKKFIMMNLIRFFTFNRPLSLPAQLLSSFTTIFIV